MLTEDKIRKIIRESVRKVLNDRDKNLLTEMALPRSRYKERIDAEIPQVLTNWCLIHYRTLTNTANCKKHWQNEFRGHMFTVSRFSVKSNDSEELRKKVFQKIIEENDYTNPKFLNLTVCNKFLEEEIDITSKEYEDTLVDCIKNIWQIFGLILLRDIEQINQYSISI